MISSEKQSEFLRMSATVNAWLNGTVGHASVPEVRDCDAPEMPGMHVLIGRSADGQYFTSGCSSSDEPFSDLAWEMIQADVNAHENELMSSYASAMGKKGGSARTPAKQAASRENGKKGGRPRAFTQEEMDAFQNVIDVFQDVPKTIWKPRPYIKPTQNKDETEK